MAKLDIAKLTNSAEACMGWPYVSPGSNDQNGIDCSGLFVKMYRDQGAKIYHGSNTIYRDYCSETGALTKTSQLREGMAVFKCKEWTDSDKGNKWYGKEPGNLSHIGYVAGVNPLRIIHASSVSGCVTTDTKIGKWKYWGKLKDVDYGSGSSSTDDDSQKKEEEGMYTATLSGGNVSKPINIRDELLHHVASFAVAVFDLAPFALFGYHRHRAALRELVNQIAACVVIVPDIDRLRNISS